MIGTADTNTPPASTTVTFGSLNNGVVQSQAGIMRQAMTADASMFVEVLPTPGRNIGVALANPGDNTNIVTITLRNLDGSAAGMPINISLEARHQISKFITELLPDAIATGFIGSLRVHSSLPVSVLGLRFSGTAFSTLSVTTGAGTADVPPRTLMAGALASTPAAG